MVMKGPEALPRDVHATVCVFVHPGNCLLDISLIHALQE
jgi:hypothetical protein